MRDPSASAFSGANHLRDEHAAWFLSNHYGLFTHYTYRNEQIHQTIYPDGSFPASLDELGDQFNAVQFAADANAFGVDYVTFTAWHAAMNVLFPSTTNNKWRPGHATTRDVIQDLIHALQPYDIKLMLYIHVTDGMDFTAECQAATGWNDPTDGYRIWNDYINDVIKELGLRYGSGVAGYWLDMVFDETFQQKIDKHRLRASLLAGYEHRIVIGNGGYGDGPIAQDGIVTDYASKEMFNIPLRNEGWLAADNQIATVATINGNDPFYYWWASVPQGRDAMMYTPEDMLRFTVLEAGVNRKGGGMLWAAGNYAGFGTLWEDRVYEGFAQLGSYIRAVHESLKHVYPSASYIRESGTTLSGLTDGIVATTSMDDRFEFIHVLYPPESSVLSLPAPSDGKRFGSGVVVPSGQAVSVRQTADRVIITLEDEVVWSSLHTVIKLEVLGVHE